MVKKRGRRGLVMIAAGWALTLAIFVLGALPGLAISDNTQDLLDQLAYLQQVHIQPEWLPDIRSNEAAVQALLDDYMALSLAERKELAAEDRTALRAYFEALYEVQGKDVEGVDALFQEATAARSGSGASSRSAASGSASASSRASSSASGAASSSAVSAASDPASAPSGVSPSEAPSSSLPVVPAPVAPASGSEDISSQPMPAAAEPPQAPGDDGWLGLFGSGTLGTASLMLLAVVAAILFVRFLVALRRAEKEGAVQAHVDARAQEMFGESYDPVDDPLDEGFLAPPPADFLDTAPAPLIQEETPLDHEEEEGPPRADFAMFAPDAAKKEGFFARRKREKQEKRAAEELADLQADTLDSAEGAFPVEQAKPWTTKPTSPAAARGGSSRFDKAFPANGLAVAEDNPFADVPGREDKPLAKEAEPLFTANPDRRNSITTRSFSSPRTGRPGKMPFRQGEPDDLDAIDE